MSSTFSQWFTEFINTQIDIFIELSELSEISNTYDINARFKKSYENLCASEACDSALVEAVFSNLVMHILDDTDKYKLKNNTTLSELNQAINYF